MASSMSHNCALTIFSYLRRITVIAVFFPQFHRGKAILIDASSTIKKTVKFDWTKIHLVYFALAAFDLLAIASGLGLSEWSKNAHYATIQRLDQTNFLRKEIAEQENFAMKLSAIANDLFLDVDIRKGQRDFKILTSFNTAMSKPEVMIQKLEQKFPVADSSVAVEAGASASEVSMHQRLNRLGPDVLHSFEQTRSDVKVQIDKMIEETQLSLYAYALGNRESAATHMGYSDNNFRNILDLSFNSDAQLDVLMQRTVSESDAILKSATLWQYIIGGAMLMMIGLACSYAYYVGRVLREKYLELQKAHDESVESAAIVQTVNEGVTKLNVELADNMKRLSEAQDDLVKKGRMEQLGHLTATVAHELRNPLGAVRTSSFLLERKLKDKGMGVEPQLQRISNGISRCDNIITQLLDFSRTNKLMCKESDLDQWLIKVVEDLAKRLPESVAFTCELGLENQLVPFDEARLERAIINLVSNASEAMVGNGTEPSKIVTSSPHIRITTQRIGDLVSIQIADNGPGIPADILDKIREPLFTTKSFGTGLGIPAVEQIAHQHGGKLDISSVHGQGSIFTLCLPLPVEIVAAA
jgi:signal transduction histidine kinase